MFVSLNQWNENRRYSFWQFRHFFISFFDFYSKVSVSSSGVRKKKNKASPLTICFLRVASKCHILWRLTWEKTKILNKLSRVRSTAWKSSLRYKLERVVEAQPYEVTGMFFNTAITPEIFLGIRYYPIKFNPAQYGSRERRCWVAQFCKVLLKDILWQHTWNITVPWSFPWIVGSAENIRKGWQQNWTWTASRKWRKWTNQRWICWGSLRYKSISQWSSRSQRWRWLS